MRRQALGHRPLLLFIASLVVVGAFAAPAASQAPLDPNSLVGDWRGSWTNTKARGANGQYYLKIDQVRGNKVFGEVSIAGTESLQFKMVGTLEGNRLTFGTQNPTEFLIEGKQMTGRTQGSARGNPWEITLTKAK